MVEVDGGDFNYDDKVLVETSQERGYDFWIRPIGAIVNMTPKVPQTFVIEPLVDRYLQNNKTRLELRVKVTRRNGDPLSPLADIVAQLEQEAGVALARLRPQPLATQRAEVLVS